MRRTRRITVLTSTIVVLGMVMSGCGSSKGGSAADSGATTTQQTSASAPSGTSSGGGSPSSDSSGGSSSAPSKTSSKPIQKLVWASPNTTVDAGDDVLIYGIPKQAGYFKDEGLDVERIGTDGSTAALQALASGSADVATASAVNIAQAIGKGLPIKAFAGLTMSWPYDIATLEGSSIKTLQDLKGKSIGVSSLASASYPDLIAALKSVGISEDQVQVVPVGGASTAAAALQQGKIDALDSYTESLEGAEQLVKKATGKGFSRLPRPDYAKDLFSVTFVTRTDLLNSKRDELIGYVRATYKSLVYAATHENQALKLGYAEFSQLPGKPDESDAGFKDSLAVMESDLSYLTPVTTQPDPMQWGNWLSHSNDRWDKLLQFAYDSGQTDTKLPVDKVYDGSLMDQIYDFDRKAVVDAP